MTFKELDIIYEYVDDMCQKGEFESLDRIFKGFRAEEMELDAILAYIISSLPAKSKLPNRWIFIDKAKQIYKDSEYPKLWDGL